MKRLCNNGWNFAKFTPGTEIDFVMQVLKGEVADDEHILANFAPVDVPHDWMIHDTLNLYQSSIGVYTKNLILDSSKHNSLYFEGVYMNTTIYLNGQKILFWPYGYSSFEVDLTPYQKAGDNEVVVFVEYKEPNTRWYSGAGIFRDVYHLEKESIRLVTDGIYFSAVKTAKGFRAYIDTEVIGDQTLPSIQTATVETAICDGEGKLIASKETELLVYREKNTITELFELEDITVWSLENPYLYRLVTKLYVAGELVDEQEQMVGFRTICFDKDHGFFLNGKPVKIHGACMHHDLGALGSAFNECALRRQFRELKKMGINSVRTSHNMPAKALMRVADEMGILIDSEAFDMWEMKKTTNDYGNYFHDYCERDVESWIRRDRNHASVIMWSIGNEIPDTNNPGSEAITIRLREAMRRNDYRHNAYSTIGSNHVAWKQAQLNSDLLELSGYNYLERIYDAHHEEEYPHWVIYGSETSSTVQSRGIYHFPKENCMLTYEDMQCSCLDNCHTNWGARSVHKVITDDRDREFCFGQYIWTGWDYIGEPTPYFSKNSFFGHIDTAGFWKDTAYIFKAAWVDYHEDAFVHISPYWDYNKGQLIDIAVYSNAPKIALYFNDTLVGEKELDQKKDLLFSGYWKLPYEEGVLRAVAYDTDGSVLATEEAQSFGNAVKVSLLKETETIKANGEDIQFIAISVVDEKGIAVANARNRVSVSVEGPGRLVGLDNGDSTDYDQYKTNSRKLFSGKLMAMVASTREAGLVTVTVQSEGLEPASITFETTPSDYREGSCCSYQVPEYAGDLLEVPIRKITVIADSATAMSKEHQEVRVRAIVEPANATHKDIVWKATTYEGIASNAVSIEADGTEALIKAVGDGKFRLICSASNGKPHTEVMSELEFEVEGLGNPLLDPYDCVHGCQYASSTSDAALSYRGGVNLTANDTIITFDLIDFGEYGSDELGFSIFTWRAEEHIQIFAGSGIDGELLYDGMYRAEPIYNVFSENIFKLSRRVKGVGSLTFHFTSGFVFGGFRMLYQEKAYGLLYANEHNMITGDSYREEGVGVYEIGNNVDIEFLHMNLSRGVKGIEITGKSRIPSNPVHVRFMGETSSNQVCEFTQSDAEETQYFELEDVRGENKLNFIFLPGSDFDLISFRLIPRDETISN